MTARTLQALQKDHETSATIRDALERLDELEPVSEVHVNRIAALREELNAELRTIEATTQGTLL